MKTTLYIVRHAEAEGNLKRIFHGWTDSEITEKGYVQAEKIGERLAHTNIDMIISSPLTRTRQTAEYIAKHKNLKIEFMESLKEINGGEWEGKTWEELKLKYPMEFEMWDVTPHLLQMPNGESMEKFQERIILAFEEIIDANKGKNICVVTHGTAIKTLLCYFKELQLKEMLNISWCDNTALSVVEHSNSKFNIILEGDDTHLNKELLTLKNQGWLEELEKKISNAQIQSYEK